MDERDALGLVEANIDRERRRVCQLRNSVTDPVMHMYYEGQVVALENQQSFVEKAALRECDK